MTRDFIYRQILPWLEHELQNYDVRPHGPIEARQAAAASLANHLWNNWQMVERAKAGSGFTMQELTQAALDKMKRAGL